MLISINIKYVTYILKYNYNNYVITVCILLMRSFAFIKQYCTGKSKVFVIKKFT